MNDTQSHVRRPSVLGVILSVIVSLTLLAGAVGALYLIYTTEPTAQREGATRKSAALVETIKVSRGDHRPQIVVLGKVEPARDITFSPRVAGQVTEIDSAFVPGGIVSLGDPLLKLDPADFEATVAMRRSDLQQARADLAIELGRQEVAKQEFKLLGEDIDPANRALVLREPQIASSRARVKSARAALDQAELDLARTQISAPFDAQILRRNVNVGSQVAPGDNLARLVGIDEYWVTVTVPLRHLRWLRFPNASGEGSTVQLENSGTWEPDAYRTGRVVRMIGTLDDETRMARVLVAVKDPLARTTTGPALILGSILEARIEGNVIENVTRLKRDYVRDGDTIWVLADDKLAIRPATVVFRDASFAYVGEGLHDGDEVVTTNLATVVDGIGLRRVASTAARDGQVDPDGVEQKKGGAQ